MAEPGSEGLMPMTDADVASAPAGDTLQPTGQPAGDSFQPAGDTSQPRDEAPRPVIADAREQIRAGAEKLRAEAGDRARTFAEDGKARASGALGQVSEMLEDAAAQVDEKLGGQYGQYARAAADRVRGFGQSIDEQDIDELVDAVRGFVRKSPAVAIGIAAAVGFVAARVIGAGLDDRNDDREIGAA